MMRTMLLLSVLMIDSAFAQTLPVPVLEHGLIHCGFNEEFEDCSGIDIKNTGEEGYNWKGRLRDANTNSEGSRLRFA